MEFLAPAMLVGAIGAAIPVVIHLIGRRRAKVVRFAAIDFLLGSNRKTARRLRLRELLLLIIRALACLAVALVLAKPYASCTAEGPSVERGPQAAVLVIDDSLGAAYRRDGESLVSRARREARSILDQLGPEADVALVLTAEGSPSPDDLSRDHIRLRERISAVSATARPPDTSTALERAARLLEGSDHERKTIYLLSPMAAVGFRDEAPWPPGAGPALRVVDLGGGRPMDNLAVAAVEMARDPNAGSRGIRVSAEIVNFGASAVDEHPVALRVGDRIVAQGTVSLRPGERRKKVFVAAMPDEGRSADVVVELAGDGLDIDDRRYVRADLREEVRVLLVNGDPHTVRHEDELFYLEAGLRPGDRADTGTELTTVTVDELARLQLEDFDVIVMANVRALSTERVEAVERWVRAGGGLLIAPGANVDADAYNRTMQPLMPQQLRDPVDVAYGSRGAERRGRALRLTKWEVDHPVFAVFGRDAAGLGEAPFRKIMLLGPTTRVDERRVLARYTNGAAALVEARSGSGRLMFFTSTIDRDWNDLVIYPGFLPMMQQSIRYLARKDSDRRREEVLVGKSALLRPDPDVTRLEVHGPGGERTAIEQDSLEGRKYVRFAATERPGFYRVMASDRTGKDVPRPELDIAVNVDPRGSDLRPVPDSRLPASGDGGPEAGSAEHRRRVELWHAIAAALLMLLLVESVLILRS